MRSTSSTSTRSRCGSTRATSSFREPAGSSSTCRAPPTRRRRTRTTPSPTLSPLAASAHADTSEILPRHTATSTPRALEQRVGLSRASPAPRLLPPRLARASPAPRPRLARHGPRTPSPARRVTRRRAGSPQVGGGGGVGRERRGLHRRVGRQRGGARIGRVRGAGLGRGGGGGGEGRQEARARAGGEGGEGERRPAEEEEEEVSPLALAAASARTGPSRRGSGGPTSPSRRPRAARALSVGVCRLLLRRISLYVSMTLFAVLSPVRLNRC